VHVVVNDRLVKRQARIGGGLLVVTFLMLLAGMLLSWQMESWAQSMTAEGMGWLPIAITYLIVIAALGLYYFGNTRMRRFGPQHRQDARLRQILKGLDDRYTLYGFLGGGLPDYILAGPSGVYVLTARPQGGEITCREDRWISKGGAGRRIFTALYGNPIGSPSQDTAQGVQRVQAFLDRSLPAGAERPQVSGLIVFTGENVRLRSERCTFTATTGRELRKVVTRQKVRSNNALLAQVKGVFESALQR
jgi:hypothetical protein